MITRSRAPVPLKALLLAGAMAFGTVALSSAASAATYTLDLSNGVQTTFNHDVAGGVDDTFQLNLTPSPTTGTGTLNLSGLSFSGLQLDGIKLTSGAAFGQGGATLINPTTYNVTNVDGLASFSINSGTGTTPLFLTFQWGINGSGGDGSYYGAIRYTYTQAAPQPVPGPIAGAGIPAAFAFGGLLWARRRKAATA